MRFYGGNREDKGVDDAPEAQAKEEELKSVENGDAGGGSSVAAALTNLVDRVDGAIGAALVDFDGGFTLGTAGKGDVDMEVAGPGSLDLVHAEHRILDKLGVNDNVEDILITLGTQYHVIRALSGSGTLYVYLAIDRRQGNLGLARHQIRSIESELNL